MSDAGWLFGVTACVLFGSVLLAALRARLIVGHPRLVLGLVALVSLAALASLVRLSPPGFRIMLDPSTEPLVHGGDHGLEVYDRAVRAFGSDDLYVVAMETPRSVFTHEDLEALERVTFAIERLPGVREAESLIDVDDVRYDPEIDGPSSAPLLEVPISTDAAVLARVRDRAMANPLYRKTLLSSDGRTAAIDIGFKPMTDREFIGSDLDGQIGAILQQESGQGRRFFRTGRPHIRAAGHALMVRDLQLLIPAAVVAASFFLFLMTGSLRGTLICLSTSLLGTLWSFGAMAWLRIDMNLITLVLGPLLICVGSVYGVYSFERYELIASEEPRPERAALRTLEYVRLPMFVAATTTMIGFAVYLLGDVRATHELGVFAVFGVASVWLIALTGVPSALALLPGAGALRAEESGRPQYEDRTRASALIGALIARALAALAHLATRHSGKVICGWLAAAALCALLFPRIVVDTDFLSYFPASSSVRRDFAEINRLLVGTVPIYVVFESEREAMFRDPAHLRTLETIASELGALPGVDRVLGLTELIAATNGAIDGAGERLPDTQQGTAEALFMLPKDRLRHFATSNHSSANLIVRTDRHGSAAVRDLERQIRAIISAHPIAPEVRSEVTGSAILVNRSADGIASNQVTQVGAAALSIMILVGIALRSLRLAILSILPNVMPVVLLFGALGAGVAPLSLATGLIGSMALGIAVDDTVHFLVGYRHARDEGFSREDAVARTVQTSGRAIVLTSIMLIVGFSVVLASSFATLRDFAALTAITILICLLADLTLTPALLIKFKA